MKPVVLHTSTMFHTWLQAPPRFSVLMVKMDECIPCGRVLPIFEKYSRDWSSSPNVQFAVYTINWREQTFVQSELGVTSTPTFLVYDGNSKVFVMRSAKRINELKAFIQAQVPLSQDELM